MNRVIKKESFRSVETKCQLDATEVFIADLIVSGLQDAAASCKPDT